jgi:hypothetical protein
MPCRKFRRFQPAEQFVKFPVMRAHAVFYVEHLVKTAVDFIFSEHIPESFFEPRGHFPPAPPPKDFPPGPGTSPAPGLASLGISLFSCDYSAVMRS